MDMFTQLCQEAQKIQAKYARDKKEYRTSLAKLIARAKEHLEAEEYSRFLQETHTSTDVANALVYNMTFERRLKTVVDPLVDRLNAISEQIVQIRQDGISEGVFDTLHHLRCEAYRVAKELDENALPHSKTAFRHRVDALFDRLYINLPNDQIEWLEWPVD